MTDLPPSARSALAAMFDQWAEEGRFALQQCAECKTFQYPTREACVNCLYDKLEWTDVDGRGEVLARTVTHVSAEPYFQAASPLETGLVKLDCGPIVVCFLTKNTPSGAKVSLSIQKDAAGRGVLYAAMA